VRSRLCLIAIAAITLLSMAAPGQERPRIGLVLSGGGARGIAHIGVLQVLEELRIPVDVVVGTSMGAVVGGGFAYGYTADELEEEVTRAGARRSWDELLRDAPPRNEQSYRRKQEQRDFLIDFGLGYRDGEFRLPKGILQGQNLELELLQLLPMAHKMESFDQLSLPFRAVAVDLVGKEVVLEQGNLATALRASMSLPAIFAPAEVDGKLVLDGGLVRNVPIEIARRMGIDHAIVIDIGTPLQASDVESALDVSTQMLAILTQQNVDRSIAALRPGDLLLRPDLGDISSGDFERAVELVALGKQAAHEVADKLARFSVSEQEYAAWRAAHRPPEGQLRVREIGIDNESGLADAVIERALRLRRGEVLDINKLRLHIERLFGRGDFESLRFEIRPVGQSGECDVIIHARHKSWGPTYLRMGLALDSNLKGESAFALALQINRHELNELGAEWRTTGIVGETTGIRTELFQPLTTDYDWFVASTGELSSFDVSVYDQQSSLGRFDVRSAQASASIGRLLGTWGEARLSFVRLTGDLDVDIAAPGTSGFDFEDGYLDARFEIDTFDSPFYPTSGFLIAADYALGREEFGGDFDYEQARGAAAVVGSIGRTAFIGFGRMQVGISDTVPLYRTGSVGGFLQLSGLDRGSLTGANLGVFGALVRHRLAGANTSSFGFPVYVGASLETGNVWQERSEMFEDLLLGGSIYVSAGTPLGPAYLAYGMLEGGNDSIYLFLGQIF